MRGLLAAALVVLLAAAAFADADGHQHAHPDVAIRIDQALLDSPAVLDAEKKAMQGGRIKDFALKVREDGLHASGKYAVPILPDVKFEAVLEPVWTGPDVFELRVRKIKVLLFDVTRIVLGTVQKRLAAVLAGVCAFQYAGELNDGTEVSRVTVNMSKLMPSLPALSLSGIATRDQVLILKAKLP